MPLCCHSLNTSQNLFHHCSLPKALLKEDKELLLRRLISFQVSDQQCKEKLEWCAHNLASWVYFFNKLGLISISAIPSLDWLFKMV